jgi:Tol biopolymer transport system component
VGKFVGEFKSILPLRGSKFSRRTMKKAQITLLAVLALATAATIGCSGASSAKNTVPTFTQLAFESNQTVSPATDLFLMNLDGTNVTPIATPTDGGYEPSVSANVNTVVYLNDGNIWTSNASGSTQTQVTDVDTSTTYIYSARLSPDGTKIVYGEAVESADSGDLWVMNVDGTNPVNLTSTITGSEIACYSGSFSADSTQIVFLCQNENNGTYSLNTVNADGTSLTSVFSSNATYCADWCDTPAFSADGTEILFVSDDVPQSAAKPRQPKASRSILHGKRQRPSPKGPTTGYGIVSVALDGSNPTVVNSTGAYELIVLNSTLFYTQYDATSEEDQIFSANLDGSSPVMLTDSSSYSSYLGVNVD